MQICTNLTIYYFLAIQCKLNVLSKCYSSGNLHQNVRLLNVMLLNTFSLSNLRLTAGLVRLTHFQKVLRHTDARKNSDMNALSRNFQCISRSNIV